MHIHDIIGAARAAAPDLPDTMVLDAVVFEYLDSCRRAGDFNDMTAYNRFIAAYIDDLQHS